jgi:hypothetical protein
MDNHTGSLLPMLISLSFHVFFGHVLLEGRKMWVYSHFISYFFFAHQETSGNGLEVGIAPNCPAHQYELLWESRFPWQKCIV